jgi:hypothetical protein
MLGRLYGVACGAALRFTQAFHDSRRYPQGVRSPQTPPQVQQVSAALPFLRPRHVELWRAGAAGLRRAGAAGLGFKKVVQARLHSIWRSLLCQHRRWQAPQKHPVLLLASPDKPSVPVGQAPAARPPRPAQRLLPLGSLPATGRRHPVAASQPAAQQLLPSRSAGCHGVRQQRRGRL